MTATAARLTRRTLPATRPLRLIAAHDLQARLQEALAAGDGLCGAHCIHELWMRGEIGLNVQRALDALWRQAGASVPDWLPMRHVDWLPLVYEVCAHQRVAGPKRAGRTHLYLVLLDYEDQAKSGRLSPYGIYVGMSRYTAAERFDQHKAGIRAAGSVLKRGLEVLTGPVMHLQRLPRAEAARIEEQLAEALRATGAMRVEGGH